MVDFDVRVAVRRLPVERVEGTGRIGNRDDPADMVEVIGRDAVLAILASTGQGTEGRTSPTRTAERVPDALPSASPPDWLSGSPVAATWVRGDWMQTASGGRFYPLDPRPEDVNAQDIAHALSLLCRYGGHVDRFYSVAEHSVLMSEAVAPENALAALLHDATEAYVCDVPRPLKRVLVGYHTIEDAVWVCIAAHFGLPLAMPPEVKDADNRILLTERAALMAKAGHWAVDDSYAPLPVRISGWLPRLAERTFLRRLEELTA